MNKLTATSSQLGNSVQCHNKKPITAGIAMSPFGAQGQQENLLTYLCLNLLRIFSKITLHPDIYLTALIFYLA
jgi:hypothetical protein